MDSPAVPRRRSVHFVPGGNDRFFAKALDSAADTLVLDLEDSVSPNQKPAARDAVVGWLADTETDKELMIRINALDTEWWSDDVVALAPLNPQTFMVPKVSSAAEFDRLETSLVAASATNTTTFFPVATETPAAVFAVADLAAHGRCHGVCWGAEDLSAALGAHASRTADGRLLPVFQTVQSLCLLGAAAGGVHAIDAPWTDLNDLDGLRREAEEAAAMGYVGKLTIHPDQIPIVNAAFTPSEQVVRDARELLAAFEEHARTGSGVFRHNGQMVDAPHLSRARRILGQTDSHE